MNYELTSYRVWVPSPKKVKKQRDYSAECGCSKIDMIKRILFEMKRFRESGVNVQKYRQIKNLNADIKVGINSVNFFINNQVALSSKVIQNAIIKIIKILFCWMNEVTNFHQNNVEYSRAHVRVLFQF